MSRSFDPHAPGTPPDLPAGGLLDANVERLLQRAYRPVRPAPEFVARLERRLPGWIEGAGAPVSSRWRPGRLVPLLAAAVVLVASLVALFPDGERPLELDEILARGAAARRAVGAGEWTAIDPLEARLGITLGSTREEFATPAALTLELRAGDGTLATLAPSTRATLAAVDAGESRLRLVRGSCTLAGARSSVDLWTSPGELDLLPVGGELAATLELVAAPARLRRPGAGELALLVHLDAGRAWFARGSSAVDAPEAFLVHDGALFSRAGDPRQVSAAAGTDDRSVVLPLPGTPVTSQAVLSGRVLALPEDRAVERFRVLLLRSVDLPRVAEPEWRDFDSADGAFRWEGLEPGLYSVFVQADERAQFSSRGLALTAGEERALDVDLHSGATVRGFVVDRESGVPLAGAMVLSQTDAPAQVLHRFEDDQTAVVSARTKTGPDGSFELRHLSPGEHDLRASAPEHAPSWARTFALRDGEVLDGTLFELEPGATLHGRVEHSGAPRSDALVIASQFGSGSTASVMTYGHGVTDAEGNYEIPHLAAGMYVVLLLGDVEQVQAEQPEMTATQLGRHGRVRVDFAQEIGAGSMRGRLSDPAGAPIVNATVSLALAGSGGMSGWKAAASAADGTYALEDVAPGDYHVHIGVGSGLVFQGEARIEVGAELVRDFTLSGGSIRISVVDARDGSRLEHVVLLLGRRVEPNGAASSPCLEPLIGKTWTAAADSFEFPFVAPGRYDLVAAGAEGGLAQVVVDDIEVLAGAVVQREVALAPGGTLAVAITDATGAHVPDAELDLYDPRGRRIDLFLRSGTRADGARLLPDLEPGLWRAVVSAPGRSSEERPVSIEVGETTELELRLGR